MTIKVDPRSMTLTSPWGITRTVEQWMKSHEISDVNQRFGDWCVSDYGLECLTTYYPIEAGRLWEGQDHYPWTRHMAEKGWVNLADFSAALAAARRHHAQASSPKR